MRSRISYGFTFSLIMVVLLLLPVTAPAQEPAQSEATPETTGVLIAIHEKDKEDGTRFEAEIEPGESVTLTAVLTNFGSEPIELRIYASDVIPAVNGGLRLAARGSEPSGTSLWMSFPEEEFTLQSQESIERPITINVPEETPAGQYVNAVALETVNPINPSEGGSFDQYFRKVVSVYITVPGDFAADFSTGEPEVLVMQGRSGIQIPVTNSGNVRIDLVGDVTVTSLDGAVIHEGRVQLGPIYMGQDTVIQIPLGTVPSPGDYLLTYNLIDIGSEITVSVSDETLIVPEDSVLGEAPITFENVAVEANADPIVFANVSVDVNLTSATYRSTKLTMSVYHNGELVEDFVLAENLALSQGTTTVTQRYLPATNWESGTYTFSLKLESTDKETTSLLFEEEEVATLEVP